MTSVPRPGSLSIRSAPPAASAKPWAWLSPSPRALARRLGGEERLEHAPQHLLRDAGAGVAQAHGHEPAPQPRRRLAQRLVPRRDREQPALRHGVAGVQRHVEQRQLELRRVHPDRPEAVCEVEVHLDVAAQRRAEQVRRPPQVPGGVDHLGAGRQLAREGEQVPRQPGAALRRLADVGEDAPQPLVVARQPLREPDAAHDDLEEVAEVVGDAARELAQRLQLLRLGHLLAQRVHGPLRLAPLGDVARHLGEADQGAAAAAIAPLVVADGVDHHAGPEAGAVLAHAPALGLEPPGPLGLLQRPPRHPGGAVLLGVEAGEVLADDLLRRPALDPPRARVPVGDLARGVEHEDGVVGHALHEQAEAPLALDEGLLRLPALGHVAGDLGEADHRAVAVAHGVEHGERPEAGAVLAHAPALGLGAAVAAGGLQGRLGPAEAAVLLGEEEGEVLADHLLGLVALEPARAGVPTGDPAARVDEVDGVVHHRLHEEAVGPVGLGQRIALHGDGAVLGRGGADGAPRDRRFPTGQPAPGSILAGLGSGRAMNVRTGATLPPERRWSRAHGSQHIGVDRAGPGLARTAARRRARAAPLRALVGNLPASSGDAAAVGRVGEDGRPMNGQHTGWRPPRRFSVTVQRLARPPTPWTWAIHEDDAAPAHPARRRSRRRTATPGMISGTQTYLNVSPALDVRPSAAPAGQFRRSISSASSSQSAAIVSRAPRRWGHRLTSRRHWAARRRSESAASRSGRVEQQVDRADELPRPVEQRRRVGAEIDVGAFRPFGHGLDAPHGPPLAHRDRHGAPVAREVHTLLRVELPGDAPAILADARRASRERVDACGGIGVARCRPR